jgi:hypothetical protein
MDKSVDLIMNSKLRCINNKEPNLGSQATEGRRVSGGDTHKMRKAGRHFLQIPGPSAVPDRILSAIGQQTIDHRGPDFAKVGLRALDGLKTIFKTEQNVFIIPLLAPGLGRRH